MKKVLFFAVFFLLANISLAEEVAPLRIELDLEKSRALFNAIDRFKGDGYMLKDYQVIIYGRGGATEIIFLEAVKDGEELKMGSLPNKPEVHYVIDSNGKLLRRFFGR